MNLLKSCFQSFFIFCNFQRGRTGSWQTMLYDLGFKFVAFSIENLNQNKCLSVFSVHLEQNSYIVIFPLYWIWIKTNARDRKISKTKYGFFHKLFVQLHFTWSGSLNSWWFLRFPWLCPKAEYSSFSNYLFTFFLQDLVAWIPDGDLREGPWDLWKVQSLVTFYL